MDLNHLLIIKHKHRANLAAYSARTKGRWFGHLFRRIVHVSMLLIPLIYYAWGQKIAGFFSLTTTHFLLILLSLTIIAELLRLRLRLVFFGQRKHEAKYISSFSWGVFGILLVLLFSPGRAFSIPIIWGSAIVDPLLGELRQIFSRVLFAECLGLLVLFAIWSLCGSYWLGLSLWWGVLLAPITLLAECLDLKWVDDNALMLLVPLALVLVIRH